MSSSVRKHLRPAGLVDLSKIDPGATPGAGRATIKQQTPIDRAKLEELQERLRAEGTRSLLVVLQGMDTAGKDGAIKHVIGSMNPQGCRVAAFKQPTRQELAHDFLWRIRKQLPGPGEVVVFNRSHYEDVVTVRVHKLVSEDVWKARYEEINRFEHELTDAGTIVVKVFLDISFDEQRKRLLDRLKDPSKHWKFNPHDLDDRELWEAFQIAYADAMTRCSTGEAPWYIVPANHKRYRDWAIGRLLCEILDAANARYPEPNLDIKALKKRLQ